MNGINTNSDAVSEKQETAPNKFTALLAIFMPDLAMPFL